MFPALPPLRTTARAPGTATQPASPANLAANPALLKSSDLASKAAQLLEYIKRSARYTAADKADEEAALMLIRSKLQALEASLRAFDELKTPKNKGEALRSLERARKDVLAAARECKPHVIQSKQLVLEVEAFSELEAEEPVSPRAYGIEWQRAAQQLGSNRDQSTKRHAPVYESLTSSVAGLYFNEADPVQKGGKSFKTVRTSSHSDDIRPMAQSQAMTDTVTMCNIASYVEITGTCVPGGRNAASTRYDPDEVSSVEQPWPASTPSALVGPNQLGQGSGARAQALQAMRNQDRSLMASRGYARLADAGSAPPAPAGGQGRQACAANDPYAAPCSVPAQPDAAAGGSGTADVRRASHYSGTTDLYAGSDYLYQQRSTRRKGRGGALGSLVRGVLGIASAAIVGGMVVFGAAAMNTGLDELKDGDASNGRRRPLQGRSGAKKATTRGDDHIPAHALHTADAPSLLMLARG